MNHYKGVKIYTDLDFRITYVWGIDDVITPVVDFLFSISKSANNKVVWKTSGTLFIIKQKQSK